MPPENVANAWSWRSPQSSSASATTSTSTAVFSRIARRLIMKSEWLTPRTKAAKSAQRRGRSCRRRA
jgi:hypothetical protein